MHETSDNPTPIAVIILILTLISIPMQTSISKNVTGTTFTQYINQWQGASFSQLNDAFSQPNQLRVSAFQLSLQDTLALVNNPQTRFLAIHMSLVDGQWTPNAVNLGLYYIFK
ncbi:hypothetical protein BKI52_19280 [marine bacterium AO1-C]|nr:hypothetical protein BKI52_19280 [marine bacterium AO1-C]